ncbi:MAG: energy-coupling factor ABC transporter ATP-binding protein [Actinomycetia bacterium]|nr:energy-coupling factor ABC transporter ATP-binding protein [Actinomycetes bacterium]
MSLIADQVIYRYPQGTFELVCNRFEIGAGEFVIVRGANGSGKSTLLRLLTGIIRPDNGTILFNSDDTALFNLAQFGQRIGYLFQEPDRQLFASTVIEELTILDELIDPAEGRDEDRAKTLLASFGLDGYEDRSVLTLSRGEKQRLALCAILMQDPSYLLLDEPTTGLDALNRERLIAYLRSLKEQGVGIALISHDDSCNTWGDRIVTIDAGVVSS